MELNENPKPGDRFVYVAIGADFIIAVAKFVAAAVTRSSAMLAEGVHSTIETINSVMLLWGMRMGRRPADRNHPFGYGRETYFWSLMVAVVMFGIGGGVSVIEGIVRIRHGGSTEGGIWSYAVLGFSAIFGTVSLITSLRRFRQESREDESIWDTFRRSKDPAVFTVLFEDIAALIGVALAFLGVFISSEWNLPLADPAATIAIGVLLAAVAFLIVRETKALLVGESADSYKIDKIRELVEGNPNVERMERPLTMHLGPNEILLNMAIRFKRGISTVELEKTVDELERTITENFPDVKRIFFEAESLAGRENQRAA